MSVIEKLRGLVGAGKRHEAVVLGITLCDQEVVLDYLVHHCPDEILDLDTANRSWFGDGNGDGHGGGFGGANGYNHGNGFGGYADPSHDLRPNSASASGFPGGGGRSTTLGLGSDSPRPVIFTRLCLGGRGMKKGEMYIIKMINDLDMVGIVAETSDAAIELGKAVVLTEWGTTQGLSQLRTCAKLGIYDNAEGWFINPKFVCAWIPLTGEVREEWLERLVMVCDTGKRTWEETATLPTSQGDWNE